LAATRSGFFPPKISSISGEEKTAGWRENDPNDNEAVQSWREDSVRWMTKNSGFGGGKKRVDSMSDERENETGKKLPP
jgi:hypothetical protein